MTGIVGYGAYLPVHRLTAAEIGRARGVAKRGASRRVAAFDEDAVTMAVEAGRRVRRGGEPVDGVVLCTSAPPYTVKNNASAAHAALGLPEEAYAYDLGGALRSTAGAVRAAREGTLLLTADLSVTTPDAADELDRGDAAAALLFGPTDRAAVEIVATVSSTMEVFDLWRGPGEAVASASEDRFPVTEYLPVLERTVTRLGVEAVTHVVVSASGRRTARAAAKLLSRYGKVADLDGVGHAGAADPVLRLVAALELAAPGDTILWVTLADGCDATLLRCTDRLGSGRVGPAVSEQLASGRAAGYLDMLNWRGLLDRAGPRRPAPAVPSAPASARNTAWKYGLTASRCDHCGTVSAPPQRVCVRCGTADRMAPAPLADVSATVRTFSVDRLAYSPNPPVVAAVVDFDGGGRLEVELADADVERLAVGARVRMVFRRRYTSGGVHNYAWKARLKEASDD
jgi:hydroxymethylglutaryl-CoA synthase